MQYLGSVEKEAPAIRATIPVKISQARTAPSLDASLDPGPPPDGGIRAWTQVLAAHLVVFNVWGYINSFGIFQAYYTVALAKPASTISWVGSIQIFLVFFIGTFSGRATDAGYFRHALIVGLFLQILGVFMTSLASSYWQLLLAQGICQGLGDGLVFCPTVALVSTYFSRRRTFAISCMASGAATGGIVFPAIAQSLLEKIGFAWTVRVMGLVMFVNSGIIIILARARLPPRTTGPIIEWAAFRELPYVLFAAGTFFMLWGVYYAYYYVRPYARDILGVSPYTSFSLLLILNGVGIPGRLLPALIADRYLGPINTFIPSILMAAILLYCWIPVDSLGGMYAWVTIFGVFGAAVQGLFPAALSSLTPDLSKRGVRIGMVFSIVSLACLSGPPLAGRLVAVDGGRYLGAQLFGGTVMLVGCALMISARVAQTGWHLKQRM